MNLKFIKILVLSVVLSLFSSRNSFAQTRVKKVIFQAFWWDNWNNNFRFRWADYLTELAPRLKALGVDAVWIPPNYKNDGPGNVGYGPFDHYDLGDKFQKGETLSDTVRTRSGTKDELLRMIAVMHANGIEVIQDIVLNHSSGAGNRGGGGGRDFTNASQSFNDFSTNFYKNFRYISYATPHIDTSATEYFTRTGRWSKNLHNFYPNSNNPAVNTNQINTVYFGPDMAYENNSIGQSTIIPTGGSVTIGGVTRNYFNPVQPNNYMFDNAKNWLIWYKKQTGADGFRWDAVKHFGFDLQKDASFATKYQSGFANGGNEMLNIGEWVGSRGDVDYYTSQMINTGTAGPGAPTNEQLAGGFDFGLRAYGSTGSNGAIYPMVLGNGNFDMASIPGLQQTDIYRFQDYPGGKRIHKTIPFVNSHDTYRPKFTPNGNYLSNLGNSAGWDESQELGGNGKHIDPREPRFAAANAIIAAIDGNPCFFIEDVFDIFSQNKRWTHLPTSTTDLPLRADVGNIMQAHQALKFKDGDYGVPTAQGGASAPFYVTGGSSDHIVFERSGKAIIGVTDAYAFSNNNSTDQTVWVTVNNVWPTGTVLYDYSGAHGVTGRTIAVDRRFQVSTAPNGHFITNAFGHGYSIWAPYPSGTPSTIQDLYNVLTTYNQLLPITTTQEWEMADDLGDSHCASLGQGGDLPANSTNQRVVGKIFVQNGTTVNVNTSLENVATQCTLMFHSLNGFGNTTLNVTSGSTTNFTATQTGWYTLKIRQATATQAKQKALVRVTYTAPTIVNTRDIANNVRTQSAIWTGNKGTTDINDCGNWEEGITPSDSTTMVVSGLSNPQPIINNNITIAALELTEGANVQISGSNELIVKGSVRSNGGQISGSGALAFKANMVGMGITGSSNLTVSNLTINTPFSGGVTTSSIDVTVTNSLNLTNGTLNISNNSISLLGSVTGGNANSYIRTENNNNATGFISRNLALESFTFPVGNTNYTPVTLNNTSSSTFGIFRVRCFENVLTNGLSGTSIVSTGKLNKTWDTRTNIISGLNVTATFNWNNIDEGNTFNRNSCRIAKNENGSLGWISLNTPTVAGGTNPYNLSAAGITSFSTFTVVSDASILPVTWVNFAGKVIDKKVMLSWETANEIINKGFYVERSDDGRNFKSIGFIAGNGNANSTYQFMDDYSGKLTYYRLLQEDKNGKTSYSKTIAINPSFEKQLVQIVPNPVINNVELITGNISLDDKITVEVIEAKGIRIASFRGSFSSVKAAVQTVLASKAAGVYTFVIRVKEKIQYQKVIKK